MAMPTRGKVHGEAGVFLDSDGEASWTTVAGEARPTRGDAGVKAALEGTQSRRESRARVLSKTRTQPRPPCSEYYRKVNLKEWATIAPERSTFE